MSDKNKNQKKTDKAHVLITIGEDGELSVEGMNYPNAVCGVEVGQVIDALNIEGEPEKKLEYYAQSETTSQSQNQS